MNMSKFTIVGVYTDNGQPFTDHVTAANPEEAVNAVSTDRDTLLVIAVFAGYHTSLDV